MPSIREQRQRLEQLCAIKRPLSEAEITETINLARAERKWKADKRWREAHAEEERKRCAEWRARKANATETPSAR